MVILNVLPHCCKLTISLFAGDWMHEVETDLVPIFEPVQSHQLHAKSNPLRTNVAKCAR